MQTSTPVIIRVGVERSLSRKSLVRLFCLLQNYCHCLRRPEHDMLLSVPFHVRQFGDLDRPPRYAEEVKNAAEPHLLPCQATFT